MHYVKCFFARMIVLMITFVLKLIETQGLYFIYIAVRCYSYFKSFKCFNYNTSLCPNLFSSVEVKELPPFWEKLLTRLVKL